MSTDSSNNKISVEIRKQNIEQLWFISDRWFRILEFSLILASLFYFKEKTNNIFVTIIYWFSWIIFFMWFLEIGEFISDKINYGKRFSKNKRLLIFAISMIPVMAIYTIITIAMNSIMSTK